MMRRPAHKGISMIRSKLTLCALLLVLSLPLIAMAADAKKSSTLEVSDTVLIAGKQVTPGTYKIEWTGSGSSAQLSITKLGKPVLQASAQVIADKGTGGAAALVTTKTDKGTIVKQIRLKRETLVLDQDAPAAGQ